jgi:hypothetical protein
MTRTSLSGWQDGGQLYTLQNNSPVVAKRKMKIRINRKRSIEKRKRERLEEHLKQPALIHELSLESLLDSCASR